MVFSAQIMVSSHRTPPADLPGAHKETMSNPRIRIGEDGTIHRGDSPSTTRVAGSPRDCIAHSPGPRKNYGAIAIIIAVIVPILAMVYVAKYGLSRPDWFYADSNDFAKGEIVVLYDGKWASVKMGESLSQLERQGIRATYTCAQWDPSKCQTYCTPDFSNYFFIRQGAIVGHMHCDQKRAGVDTLLVSHLGAPVRVYRKGSGRNSFLGFDELRLFRIGNYRVYAMMSGKSVVGMAVEEASVLDLIRRYYLPYLAAEDGQ